LKAFTQRLEPILGISQALLYERQRELVRGKLLQPDRPGRGPGSGVFATPRSVAVLLVASLSGTNIADTCPKVAALLKARRGAAKFEEALTAILGSYPTCQGVHLVTISQTNDWAEIKYAKSKNRFDVETFRGSGQRSQPIRVLCEIEGTELRRIAGWLSEESQ
jgi:hypothetical protein